MDEDERRAKRIAAYTIGQATDDLSVDEVDDLIKALLEEIARLEKVGREKSAHLQAAASLFKT